MASAEEVGGVVPGEDPARDALMIRWHQLPDDAIGERGVQMRRLASATRRLVEQMVGVDASVEVLASAADDLERVVERMGVTSRLSAYEGYAEVANAGGDTSASFEHSPFCGLANPLSPPVVVRGGPDGVEATVRFGAAYEGPPGCVHGGYIAGVFDELLGAAQTYSGTPGMTGTLTIWYRSPTPLHTDLRMVGTYSHTEGRRVYTRGELWAGERLCAEAEAIFVSIPPTRFGELLAERAAERDRPAGPADGD
jgi:acyl-coenzyme A thioesterase PaaI-like protein